MTRCLFQRCSNIINWYAYFPQHSNMNQHWARPDWDSHKKDKDVDLFRHLIALKILWWKTAADVSGSSNREEKLTLGLISDWVSFSISGSFFSESLLLDFPALLLLFLRIAIKPSKLKGPKAPNDERLMVAADADNGWNPKVVASGAITTSVAGGCGCCCCWNSEVCFSDKGTTPSRPWKRRNAFSNPGPSSKIGPRLALVYKHKEQEERVSSTRGCIHNFADKSYKTLNKTGKLATAIPGCSRFKAYEYLLACKPQRSGHSIISH